MAIDLIVGKGLIAAEVVVEQGPGRKVQGVCQKPLQTNEIVTSDGSNGLLVNDRAHAGGSRGPLDRLV